VYEEEYLKTLDDEQYDDLKEADKEPEEGEQNVYTCSSCGAEIVTDATTAATICYYCHNPVVLVGRLAAEMKPEGMIPFGIDEKDAKKSFMAWIKKKIYVPKDFISDRNLKNISGVYYPYWISDYEVDAHFNGEGKKISHRSTSDEEITITEYYHVVRQGKIRFGNIARSALQKADRKLADGVHPYDMEKVREFEPSLLSGFMAEKRDVESADIKESVEEEIKDYLEPILTHDCSYDSLSGSSSMNVLTSEYRYNLLPAWVVTYKGNDGKMYYYSMNGSGGSKV